MIKRTDMGLSQNSQSLWVLGSQETSFQYMDGGSWCKEPALADDPALHPSTPLLCSQPSFDSRGTNALSEIFLVLHEKKKAMLERDNLSCGKALTQEGGSAEVASESTCWHLQSPWL